MATVTKSPALTSTSPLSFLNSSIGNEAFGLEAGVDDDDVVVDARDFGGDQFALAHFLPCEGFLEQGGEVVLRRAGVRAGGGWHGWLSFLEFNRDRWRDRGFVDESAQDRLPGRRPLQTSALAHSPGAAALLPIAYVPPEPSAA